MADEDSKTMTAPALRARAPSSRFVEVVSPGTPSPFRAREGVVRIGREDGNEIVIRDPFVSRCHLEIRIFPHGVEAVDLDTKNGTHFQGARIRELALKDEVSLILGKQVTIRVRVGDDAKAHRPDPTGSELVGNSPPMERLRAALGRLSPSPLTVLIEGETGTGKEVLARSIHALSPRSNKPFVVFDCAAVSPNLIASELFGHLKGAYTGAVSSSEGAFRHAHTGTLFLDEVGELPLELQPALLRALEARQVKPVGSESYQAVDVRVVAATNRSLEAEVEAGRFRKDLLFRLAVGRLKVPPLRARAEDIPELARHFAANLGGTLAPAVLDALSVQPWPGNVRELRNAVERAVMLAGGAGCLVTSLDDDLDFDDPPEGSSRADTLAPGSLVPPPELLAMQFQDAKQVAVDTFEREYLLKLFEAAGYNLSQAARVSGVHRRYLRELFKKHGLDTTALRALKNR
ncbi:MAG: sigma 54-interacting transcriptional regulator [Deltaproteobacteria bacterium]|nr:sigma 54-interacting transcriptional regulator [Deltaproteobacteria bacterium]